MGSQTDRKLIEKGRIKDSSKGRIFHSSFFYLCSKRLLSVSFPFAILSFHLFSSDVYSLIYNFSEFRGSTWGDGRRAESFPGLQHSQQVGQPFIFSPKLNVFFYFEHLLKNLFSVGHFMNVQSTYCKMQLLAGRWTFFFHTFSLYSQWTLKLKFV